MGLGLFPEGRLGFFDFSAEQTTFVGALPAEDPVPSHIIQMVYMGQLVAHPERERIAVLTRQGSQLEIYDRDGALVAHTEGLHPFPVDYQVHRRDGFMAGARNRHGYKGGTATTERLYGLFSGRAEAHFPGASGNDAEFVHVYDWNGAFQSVYRLDREVRAIAVDPSGEALYAITHSPTPALLRFSLP